MARESRRKRLKLGLRLLALPIFHFSLVAPALACSAASCADHGVAMARTFVVDVTFDGRPLRGVNVKVTNQADKVRFSGATETDGTVRVANLPAGDYWIDIEMLGIGAAHHCFHVAKATFEGQNRVTYQWGDSPESSQIMAGRIVDPRPGMGGNVIWNITHPVDDPIAGANLTLHNPVTGETFTTQSDRNGSFGFDGVSQTTYVLHVEGGKDVRPYEPTDLLVRISPAAQKNDLLLARQVGGGGGCYGWGIVLR